MRKALSDSFIWRGVYFITTLLLNVCITRFYEASQSGWIYFISNNFYLVLLVGGLSLDSGMTYFSAGNRIANEKLATFALLWPLIVSIFSLVCTGFLIRHRYITTDHTFLLLAGAAYTFGVSLTNFFTAMFYAKHNFAVPNIYMSIINIIVIALLPFFATSIGWFEKQYFLYVYFLQFGVQGIGLSVLYMSSYTHINTLQFATVKDLKPLFRFSAIALSANVAYYLISRVDYFFVEAWCTPKSLGNYVQVSKMGQLLLIIPSIISSAVYPQAAKGENASVEKLIFKLMPVFVLMYVFVIIAAGLFSNAVFIFLFGNTFDEMYVPFIILLPGILFLSLHIIIAAYFGGRNRPFYNVISTGAGLIIVLAGDLLLIKTMGITGAALVSSFGYTVAFAVSLLLLMKKTNSTWKDIFTAATSKTVTYTSLFANQSTTR